MRLARDPSHWERTLLGSWKRKFSIAVGAAIAAAILLPLDKLRAFFAPPPSPSSPGSDPPASPLAKVALLPLSWLQWALDYWTSHRSPCEPVKYEPDRWNDPFMALHDYGRQSENNCYRYACNMPGTGFASPGYASLGVVFLDCRDGNAASVGPDAVFPDTVNVKAFAEADGLIPRPDGSQATDPCSHTVALVVQPGCDYHWYRLDDNGMWSHKRGDWPATNVDNSGQPITDPKTAARSPYTEFVGYFTVDRRKVTIA